MTPQDARALLLADASYTAAHPDTTVPKPPGSASTMSAKELSASFMKTRDANSAWAKPHLAPQEVKDMVPDTPTSPTSDNSALPRPKHMRRGTIVVQGAPDKQREIFFPHYGEALRPFLAFKAHDGSVTGVQLVPDALTPALISWGFDGAVHAWAISNGAHLGSLPTTVPDLLPGQLCQDEHHTCTKWSLRVDQNAHTSKVSDEVHNVAENIGTLERLTVTTMTPLEAAAQALAVVPQSTDVDDDAPPQPLAQVIEDDGEPETLLLRLTHHQVEVEAAKAAAAANPTPSDEDSLGPAKKPSTPLPTPWVRKDRGSKPKVHSPGLGLSSPVNAVMQPSASAPAFLAHGGGVAGGADGKTRIVGSQSAVQLGLDLTASPSPSPSPSPLNLEGDEGFGSAPASPSAGTPTGGGARVAHSQSMRDLVNSSRRLNQPAFLPAGLGKGSIGPPTAAQEAATNAALLAASQLVEPTMELPLTKEQRQTLARLNDALVRVDASSLPPQSQQTTVARSLQVHTVQGLPVPRSLTSPLSLAKLAEVQGGATTELLQATLSASGAHSPARTSSHRVNGMRFMIACVRVCVCVCVCVHVHVCVNATQSINVPS
jgi:hypothetical protein